MEPEERQAREDRIAELIASMPPHMAEKLLREAAERPDEWPTVTATTNEIYPSPDALAQWVRCYERGIFYWQWKDGTGFQKPTHDANAWDE